MTSDNRAYKDEIEEYMARFKDMSAEEILKYMGELRDFFYKYMTPEGRKIFEESRQINFQDDDPKR